MSFQDKYLFYRFLDDEREDAPVPSEEEKRESQEELQETLLFLSQIGPDAHLRMILRKPYGSTAALTKAKQKHRGDSFCVSFRPPERAADDMEIIYEELLNIKALSHLSTTVSPAYPEECDTLCMFLWLCNLIKLIFHNLSMWLVQVKRELAGVLIFESHAKAGTVCK